MRDTMLEGSGWILTIWGHLSCTRNMGYEHFCILPVSECGRRGWKPNPRPCAQQRYARATDPSPGVWPSFSLIALAARPIAAVQRLTSDESSTTMLTDIITLFRVRKRYSPEVLGIESCCVIISASFSLAGWDGLQIWESALLYEGVLRRLCDKHAYIVWGMLIL